MVAALAEVVKSNEDSASPYTVSKPSGFTSSDQRLIFILSQDSGLLSDLTTPSGWTAITNGTVDISNQRVKGWYHDWNVSDPGSWSFAYNSGASVAGHLFRCTGVDTATAPVCAAASIASNLATLAAPTVTPSSTDDLELSTYSNQGGAHTLAYTAPSGMTDQGSTQVAGGFQCMASASQQLSSGAATGTKTWSGLSPTGGAAAAFNLCIKSASGSTPVTVTDVPTGVSVGSPQEAMVSAVVIADAPIGVAVGTPSPEAIFPGSPLTITDDTGGVAVGSPTETVSFAVVVGDASTGVAVGVPQESVASAVVVADSPVGVLIGAPSESVILDVLILDAPTGTAVGTTVEAVNAAGPGATDVTVTDVPTGVALGGAQETTASDVVATDTPGGVSVGSPGENVTYAVVVTDQTTGVAVGGGIDPASADLLVVDSPTGVSVGVSSSSVVVDTAIQDVPAGIAVGGPSEAILQTIIVIPDIPTSITVGAPRETVTASSPSFRPEPDVIGYVLAETVSGYANSSVVTAEVFRGHTVGGS